MARRRHSNRRRRRGNFGFLYKLLSVLVICAAVVMALTLFFRVDTIEVTGTKRYTEKDVIEASGIQLGDNLFLLNKYEAARSIAEQLPYIDIEDIRIRRELPDTLLIDVAECRYTPGGDPGRQRLAAESQGQDRGAAAGVSSWGLCGDRRL